MKNPFRRVLAVGLALALTAASLPAFAAEEAAPITVQLDGQNVTFTDAVPQVKNQRTFLPFRTVFEAMGAEVSYTEVTETAPATISATRSGKTVTMTIGSTEATVTEGETTSTLTMDVAPYVDNATWRTYVPVRFAAQALGAAVGWDQEAQTVVIVDTEKLVDSALEGKSFTYLEKLMEYSKKYNEGIWNSEVAFDGAISMDLAALGAEGTLSVPVAVSANGVSEGETKAQVSEKITVDLTDLTDLLVALIQGSEEEDIAQVKALVDALAKDGVAVDVREDLSTGKLYLNLDLSTLDELAQALSNEGAGFDADTWYSMDIAAVYEELGIDFDELLEQVKDVDYKALVVEVLGSVDVDSAQYGYATLNTLVRTAVNALADDGFVKSGDTYTSILAGELERLRGKAVLSLTLKDEAVTAYEIELALDFEAETVGETVHSIIMDFKMGVDEKDRLTGSMTMNVLDMVTADFNITGSYTKGTTAPATEPPAGAAVVDLMELTGGLLPDQD